jgi:hypothetical protein
MTFLAALLQNRRDMLGECYRAVGLHFRRPRDEAAFDGHLGQRHFFAREHLFQGVNQESLRRLRPLITDAELIVDASLIADDAAGVEHERFRHALGAEFLRYDLALVAQHRERQLVLGGMIANGV